MHFLSIATGIPYYYNQQTKESVWEKPVMGEQVQCLHLLVKHCESRRPASWRSDNITRSKDEALELLQGNV